MPAPAGAEAPITLSSPVTSSQNSTRSTAIQNRGTSISLARRAAANAKKIREQTRQQLENQGLGTNTDLALENIASKSASTRPNVSQNKSKRLKRVKWSQDEVLALQKGVEKYGEGRWAVILREYASYFNPVRISVDLKDKWRNLFKAKKPCMKSIKLSTQSDNHHHHQQQEQQSDHCTLHPNTLPKLRPLNVLQKAEEKNSICKFNNNRIDQEFSQVVHPSNNQSLVHNNHLHSSILHQQSNQVKHENIHHEEQSLHPVINQSIHQQNVQPFHSQSLEQAIKTESSNIHQSIVHQQPHQHHHVDQLEHTSIHHSHQDVSMEHLQNQNDHISSIQVIQNSNRDIITRENNQRHESSHHPFDSITHASSYSQPSSQLQHTSIRSVEQHNEANSNDHEEPTEGLTEMETQAMFTPATTQVILDHHITEDDEKTNNQVTQHFSNSNNNNMIQTNHNSHLDQQENSHPNPPRNTTIVNEPTTNLIPLRQSHDQNQIIHESPLTHEHNVNLSRLGQFNITSKSSQDMDEHTMEHHELNMDTNRPTSILNSVHSISAAIQNSSDLCNMNQERNNTNISLDNEQRMNDDHHVIGVADMISDSDRSRIRNSMNPQDLYPDHQFGLPCENRRQSLSMITEKKGQMNGMTRELNEMRPLTTVVQRMTPHCQMESIRLPMIAREHNDDNIEFGRRRKRNLDVMMDDCDVRVMEQEPRNDGDLDGKKARAEN